MFKKLIISIVVLLLTILIFKPIIALEKNASLHLFWTNGCPHCAKEKLFLKKLIQKYPLLQIKEYEITGNQKNLQLLEKVGKELSVDVSGVPFTVIGNQYFSGFYNEETTGKEIEEAISCALKDGCVDIVSNLEIKNAQVRDKQNKPTVESIKIPIVGDVKIKNLSLPALTLIVAFLDGFNPCAMWTLLFLISLLLGMKDRKKMWILGIAFIASSSFVYFLFMAAWLNFFLFIGFIIWIRIAIGLVALWAGGYYLRDYYVNRNGSCSVMGNEKRQKVFEKIKNITQSNHFIVALFGIIILAFAVNLVELICSAGLPAIYTQILSLAHLPPWQYYLYLVAYVFIFMIDDLFIFFTAMLTLKSIGIDSKYSRLSHLVGGILMFIIGLLLLFKPEFLMFG